MIIGNGILANEFSNYANSDDILIFASGVSNSKETRQSEFDREKTLLRKTIKNEPSKKIIYFSTCSMYDNYFENNQYVNHKLDMEKLISTNARDYLIIRLSQVVGKNNDKQLMGFLYNKILSDESFELYDIERNIIDISDVKTIVTYIIENNIGNNKTINIANPNNIKVIDLVKKIENLLNKKPIYSLIKIEGDFNIDISDISHIIQKLNLFDEQYEEKVIGKYYG